MDEQAKIGRLKVCNKRADADDEFKPDPGDVLINIDRPNLLANPFKYESLKTNLELFSEHVKRDFMVRGPISRECLRIAQLLISGQNVSLLCWCKPAPCHGDIIADYVQKLVNMLVTNETKDETIPRVSLKNTKKR